MFRVGIGYDIHPLVEGRPLILGGVHVPSERGLKGHSDGDALYHAVADALLGALALGDLGKFFPDTDPRWKDADSGEILAAVVARVRGKHYRPVQVDTNIIAQRPRLAPFIDQFRGNLADRLGIPLDCVSVKARTNEKLDAIGQGAAIAVQAIVMVSAT